MDVLNEEEAVVAIEEDDLHEPLVKKSSFISGHMPLTRGISHLGLIETDVTFLESLDYEIIENDLFKQDWRARTKQEVFQYVILKWTFACIVGIGTGFTAWFINMATENIAGAKTLLIGDYMQSNQYFMAFIVFAGINVVLVLLAAFLCVFVAPAAAGSGIPEVKAYLNGVDAPAVLAVNTLVVKVIGSILAVSSGLFLGKEGPMVHTGACIAAFLAQGGSKRYGMAWKWLRLFKNDRDRRDLVTCGSAAGVAAAFRAPLGGVLFALEEITSWWRSSLLWRTFFTTAVVAIVLQIGRSICKQGKCGLFGEGGLIMFDIDGAYTYFELSDLLLVLVLGIGGGILGSLFNTLNTKFSTFFAEWLNRKGAFAKIAQACILSLITSACCFGLPWVAPCRDCPNLSDLPYECPTYGRSGNFKNFNCPAGQYNDLAGLFFATKDDAVKNIFSTGTSREYHYISVLTFLVGAYILSLTTYGVSVPSGLFIPVILNGATFGRLVGMLFSSYNIQKVDEGLCAVLGAASFLGGSMRMTVALCVILLELTNLGLSMLPMMMLVLLISKTVGDLFNIAIYDLYIRMKGFPILEMNPEPFMHQLTVKDAITRPLVKFNLVEQVGNIYMTLSNSSHNAYPVVDGPPLKEKTVFCGLVLRSHLLVLLANKEFQASSSPERKNSCINFSRLSALDFAKPASGKGIRIEDIVLSGEEMQMFVDLQPIINTSPYTVLENMSLAKAYTLFRQLGLRHLCVMPKTSEGDPILGILTRHAFLPATIVRRFPHIKNKPKAFTSIPKKSNLL